MTKSKNLINYLILGTVLMFGGCSKERFIEIYNPKINRFVEEEDGIRGTLINKNIEYFDKNNLQVFIDADSIEKNSLFEFPKKDEFILLEDSLIFERIKKNLELIKKIDTQKVNIDKRYEPIKNLLSELNEFYKKEPERNYKTLRETYITIGENINDSTDLSNLSLEEVLSGKGGTCVDMISTFCPFLKYYGYNVDYVLGEVNKDTLDFHTWISVKINGESFDLDPTWYNNNFVPLKKRIKFEANKNTKRDVSKKSKN